jgi:RNA polymerase sigma factor (sigma-70 family)
MRFRPTASDELVAGYEVAAQLAERRRDEVLGQGDEVEAKAWDKIVRYCRMMAEQRYVDAPDGKSNFTASYDIRVLDQMLLAEIMDDAERGIDRTWTRYHQMALDAALALLTPMERIVAQMYYSALVKQLDIAEMLGITQPMVSRYVQSAKKKWEKLREKGENITFSGGTTDEVVEG